MKRSENPFFSVNEDGTITIKVAGTYRVESDGPHGFCLTRVTENTEQCSHEYVKNYVCMECGYILGHTHD